MEIRLKLIKIRVKKLRFMTLIMYLSVWVK